MRMVARMIEVHLCGVINATVLERINAIAGSVNSRLQQIKARVRGYRNRQRFRNAIYYRRGIPDLWPYSFQPPVNHTDN